eukprot:3738817-Pyramimonas_sp.AAC.1
MVTFTVSSSEPYPHERVEGVAPGSLVAHAANHGAPHQLGPRARQLTLHLRQLALVDGVQDLAQAGDVRARQPNGELLPGQQLLKRLKCFSSKDTNY